MEKEQENKKPTTLDIKNKFAKLNNLSLNAAQAEKNITNSNISTSLPIPQTEPKQTDFEPEALGKKDVDAGGMAMDSILKKNRMSDMSGTVRLQKQNHGWLKTLSLAESIGAEVLVNNILDQFYNQNKEEINRIIRRHMKKF